MFQFKENTRLGLLKFKDNLLSLKNKLSKFKMLIIVGLLMLILLIFFSGFKTSKKTETKIDLNNLSALEYCEVQENRLKCILKNVKGIGNVDVFLAVDASPEIKYLEQTNSSGNNISSNLGSIQTTIVMARNGNLYTPVVVVERLPKITGVLIVATGAKEIRMKNTLMNIVSSVLGVSISNVEVLEGK